MLPRSEHGLRLKGNRRGLLMSCGLASSGIESGSSCMVEWIMAIYGGCGARDGSMMGTTWLGVAGQRFVNGEGWVDEGFRLIVWNGCEFGGEVYD
ncbi:hypothetical protein M0R45_017439 [Rubus argutus]|uniref:Uncharacterized protein n=1 Tax=Rubus argutus TaxID=59490 RepID=A0AAW1XYD2_RUBAR